MGKNKISFKAIEFIVNEYALMKNQFIGISDKDIMIHCYKVLKDKNKARKNDRMGKSSQETI